jgi:two-component system sensor histidine kinase QseC
MRRQLLVLLLAAVTAVWLAMGVASYVDARHEVDELLDAHLAQAASLLIAQAGHDLEEIEEHAPDVHRYARRVAFQFWEGGTRLRLHSSNAPLARLSARDEGFSDARIDGQRWRVFSGWDRKRRYVVQVGERLGARDEIVKTMARNLLLPLAVGLPLLALLVFFAIGRALRPLRVLNREVAHRAPDRLAPLDVGRAPAEVAPLVQNLNALFDRVQASIEGERTRALDNVIAGCDRAAHLVDQLLTLARLEPGMRGRVAETVSLAAAAQSAIADGAPFARGRDVEIELRDHASAPLRGDARLLGIQLRNLLDNAVRDGPPKGVVRVDVGHRDARAFVTISDRGPGVAASERARLGRRFERLGAADVPGTGLGLSIVARIAELHGAELAFDEAAGGGLAVTVTFPAV